MKDDWFGTTTFCVIYSKIYRNLFVCTPVHSDTTSLVYFFWGCSNTTMYIKE